MAEGSFDQNGWLKRIGHKGSLEPKHRSVRNTTLDASSQRR
jgi:hypothetical protein